MLLVQKFSPAFGLPDISPFVIKLETWLRLAKIPYETAPGDPRKAPKKKLPAVVDDGVTVGDSRFIIEHLTAKHGVKLDDGLSPAQRAVATAFQSMIEEHLYFLMVYERWVPEANWERLLPTMKEVLTRAGVPGPLSGMIAKQARKGMLAQIEAQGTGRHSAREAGAISAQIIDALATQIGEGPYFFGAQPRGIDATAFAFLWSILGTPFEGPLRDAAAARPVLRAYVDRLRAALWA